MIAFSALIFFPLFIKDKKSSIISKLKYVLIVSVLCIIFGGFWYIRNWILFGSPIYPLSLSIGDIEIFNAIENEKTLNYIDISSSTLLANVHKPEMWNYIFMNITKAGILYILLIPVIIISLFKAFKRNNLNIIFLFILVLYYCLIVILTPTVAESEKGTLDLIKDYNNIVRYGFIGFYLVLLIGLYFLSKIKNPLYIQLIKITIALSSLIAVLFSLPGFITKSKYSVLILFALLLMSLIIFISLKIFKFKKMKIRFVILLLISLSVFIGLAKNYKDTYRGELYNIYYSKQIEIFNKSTNLMTWYYKNIHDKKVKIYGLKSRNYPFYGIDYENDILFDINGMSNKNIDFIIIARDFTEPISDQFGKLPVIDESIKNDKNFELVYEDQLVNVYRKLHNIE